MKIGTLLTTAIVSLSTVGGGLAVYVAVTKYQTMDRIAEAQGRLAIVRAVGDIPRYLNPERGFSTNILYGPATVDPAQLTEQDRLRKQTDGAREKMTTLRKELPGSFDDGNAIGSNIDGINSKFTALRETIDKAIAGPAEARKDAAKKVVTDNAVLNGGVTALLNEQVRRMAILNGDAYRQASYANIAMTLRDIGGFNSSVHKILVGGKKVATEAEKAEVSRAQGRNDQLVMSLMELRGNPATSANVAAALEKLNSVYVEEFGRELKLAKDGAVSGKYEHDVEAFYAASQRGLGAVIDVRDAFYDNAEQILANASSTARMSFSIALAGLAAVLIASIGLVVTVRRRVCAPIVSLTTRMSRLAEGEVAEAIPGAERSDEIGAMAAAVQVFKDNMTSGSSQWF
nr:HAMP domain-containing protein [Bradyrhizobium sp. Cp5.3]